MLICLAAGGALYAQSRPFPGQPAADWRRVGPHPSNTIWPHRPRGRSPRCGSPLWETACSCAPAPADPSSTRLPATGESLRPRRARARQLVEPGSRGPAGTRRDGTRRRRVLCPDVCLRPRRAPIRRRWLALDESDQPPGSVPHRRRCRGPGRVAAGPGRGVVANQFGVWRSSDAGLSWVG